MSVDRQFGVHEIPGTEAPVAQKPRTMSAGFEGQVRGYVDAIWLKIAELEGRIDDFEGWRTVIAMALKDATGIDPRRVSRRPLLVTAAGEATGERLSSAVPPKPSDKPRGAKPWEAEGVSKATWYRRHKEASA
jgi:hypothetical protein